MQIEISVYIWSIRTSLGMRTEIWACALIVAKVTVKQEFLYDIQRCKTTQKQTLQSEKPHMLATIVLN